MTASVRTRSRTSTPVMPAGPVLVLQPPSHAAMAPLLLSPGLYHLGRDAECEFVVDAEGIAPQHVQLVVQAHSLVLKALDSRTWVNDFLVKETALRRGDRISLGPLTFTLRAATPDDLLTQLPEAFEPEPVAISAVRQPVSVATVDATLAQVQADRAAVESVALATPPVAAAEPIEEPTVAESADVVPTAVMEQTPSAPREVTPTVDRLAEQMAKWEADRAEQERELADIRTQLATLAAGLEERESRLHAFEIRLTRREDALDQRHAEFDTQRTALDARETALAEERLRLETVAANARAELTAETEKQTAAWAEWEESHRHLTAQLNEQFAEIEAAESRCAAAKTELQAEQQTWSLTHQSWIAERAEWDTRREEQQLELAQWEAESHQQRDELARRTAQLETQRAELHAEACQRAAAHRELFAARQETQRERRLLAEQQAAWMAERESQGNDLRERRRRFDADEREIAELRRTAQETLEQLERDRAALAAFPPVVIAPVPSDPVPVAMDVGVSADSAVTVNTSSEEIPSAPEEELFAKDDQPTEFPALIETEPPLPPIWETFLPAESHTAPDWSPDRPEVFAAETTAGPVDEPMVAESMFIPTVMSESPTPDFAYDREERTAAAIDDDSAYTPNDFGAHSAMTDHQPSGWSEAWNSPTESPVVSGLGGVDHAPAEFGFNGMEEFPESFSRASAMEPAAHREEIQRDATGISAESLFNSLSTEFEPEADASDEDLHSKLAKMFGLPENFGHQDAPAPDECSATTVEMPASDPVIEAEEVIEAVIEEPIEENESSAAVDLAGSDEDWRARLALMLATPKVEVPSEPPQPEIMAPPPIPVRSAPKALEPVPSPAAAIEEDSIAAYMERLLARNKMSSDASDFVPVTKPVPSEPAPPPMASAPMSPLESMDDHGDDAGALPDRGSAVPFESRTRVDKDEVRAALQSFRQVANFSARSALATHSSKTVRGDLAVQGVLTGLATLAAAGYWCGPLFGGSIQPLQGTGCLVAAGVMGWQISRSLNRLKNWNPDDVLLNEAIDETAAATTNLGDKTDTPSDAATVNELDGSPASDDQPRSFQETTRPEPVGGMIGPGGDLGSGDGSQAITVSPIPVDMQFRGDALFLQASVEEHRTH